MEIDAGWSNSSLLRILSLAERLDQDFQPHWPTSIACLAAEGGGEKRHAAHTTPAHDLRLESLLAYCAILKVGEGQVGQ